MPYLDEANRERVERDGPTRPGDLNYVVTKTMIWQLQQAQKQNGGRISYQMMRDVLSDVEEAAREFRRRLLGPYETIKAQTNGDPYEELTR